MAVYRKVMEVLQNEIKLRGANLDMKSTVRRQIEMLVGKHLN